MIDFSVTKSCLTFAGVLMVVGTLLDYALRDSHKSSVLEKLISIARVGSQPLSLAFYGLVTLVSVFFTIVVLTLNARFHPPIGWVESSFIGLTSTAPILLAVIAKILCGDYLLALKSSCLLRLIANTWQVLRTGTRLARWRFVFLCAALVLTDLFLTGFLTEKLLNWGEVFQSKHVNTINTTWANAIRDLVDSFDIVIKDAIQRAFYLLNGSLVMYACSLASTVAVSTAKHLNVEEMKKHIFKVIAGSGILLTFVVALARDIANR